MRYSINVQYKMSKLLVGSEKPSKSTGESEEWDRYVNQSPLKNLLIHAFLPIPLFYGR